MIIYGIKQHHSNPLFWEDPNEFRPERFESEHFKNMEKQYPQLFTPFGVGHRSCIGKKFALIEAVVVLALLLQRYTVTVADKNYGPMERVSAITDRPKKTVKLIFTRRQ